MRTTNESLEQMPRSGIRVIMDLAADMEGVIHMELGEPSFQTPGHIVEAGCKALRDGFTKYTPNNGLKSLREAVVNRLLRDGYQPKLEQIGISPGSVFALVQAITACTNAGDEVLLSDPGWPNYYMQVVASGRVPVMYPLREECHFEPQISDLESLITERTRVLVINTPSNPTGSVYSRKTVEDLVDFARRHDIYIVSDEVYDKIVFDGTHFSPLFLDPDDRVISIFGVSKSYAMTGWRVGYYCAPRQIVSQMNKLIEPYVSCAPAVSQKAAEAALNGPQDCVQEMAAAYAQRRDLICELLQKDGFEFSTPRGAFYLLVNIAKAGLDSYEFARQLLKATHVAVAPGLTFGKNSDHFVRLSFCTSMENIRKSISQFSTFYSSRI